MDFDSNPGPGSYNHQKASRKHVGGSFSRDERMKQVKGTPDFYNIQRTVPDVPKYLVSNTVC